VPSRFFNCRACVPVYRSTSRPHGPPYREALAGGALRLRPDRIRGCPAAVPPAPAAAAVCLYLPPPQDTFGRRSVVIDTPFVCGRQHRNSFCCHTTLPTLSRAVSRAYANANHCESIHLHTAFAPANAAACASGGHMLRRLLVPDRANKATRMGWRERKLQGTTWAGNYARQQQRRTATRPQPRTSRTRVQGTCRQTCSCAAGEMSSPLPAPAEISIGDSAGRAAERRAPLSALRLSHADRSQFFTEVATV
jgi:hypothetical protein